MSGSLLPYGLKPFRLLCPWDSSGKNTGVGCHFLFQGIFPTQGSNPGIPHCRQILYHLRTKCGLLFPSSGDLPDPGIEATSLMSPALTDGFFTASATWEALCKWSHTVYMFVSGLFHSSQCCGESSFLLLNSIPSYECTTICHPSSCE